MMGVIFMAAENSGVGPLNWKANWPHGYQIQLPS